MVYSEGDVIHREMLFGGMYIPSIYIQREIYSKGDVYSKEGEYIWHKLMDGSMAGGIDDVQM